MACPHQVRREDEAALEYRHDEQPLRSGPRDILRHLLDAPRDLRLGKQNVDQVTVDFNRCHGPAFEPESPWLAKPISISRAVSGGEAMRVTKEDASPGSIGRVVLLSSHA